MSLTFPQWLKLAAGTVKIAPAIIDLWPKLKPIVQDISNLLDDLHAQAGKGQPMPAKEFVTRSHSLSVEEQKIFDRHGPE